MTSRSSPALRIALVGDYNPHHEISLQTLGFILAEMRNIMAELCNVLQPCGRYRIVNGSG